MAAPHGYFDVLPADVKDVDPLVPFEEALNSPDGRDKMDSWKGTYRYVQKKGARATTDGFPDKVLFFAVILYETVNEKGRKVFRQTAGVYPATWFSTSFRRMVYPFGTMGVEKWDRRTFEPYLRPLESWREYDCRRYAIAFACDDPKKLQKVLDQMLNGKVHELLKFETGMSRPTQAKVAMSARLVLVTYDDLGPVTDEDTAHSSAGANMAPKATSVLGNEHQDGSDCSEVEDLDEHNAHQNEDNWEKETASPDAQLTELKAMDDSGLLAMHQHEETTTPATLGPMPPGDPAVSQPAAPAHPSPSFDIQKELEQIKSDMRALTKMLEGLKTTIDAINSVSWEVHQQVVPLKPAFGPDVVQKYGLSLPCDSLASLHEFNERLTAEPELLAELIKKFKAETAALSTTERTNYICRKIFSVDVCSLFIWKSPNSLYENKAQFVDMTGLVALFNGVFNYSPPSEGISAVKYEYRETSDGKRKRVAINEPPYKNLAIGIGIQNFPEGLAVSLPLHGAGFSLWKSFWYGQLSGIVEPIAGVMGAFAVGLAEPMLPFALAFAGGAMVFVVFDDIIPEAQMSGNKRLASWAGVAGFLVMMVLDVAFGSEDAPPSCV